MSAFPNDKLTQVIDCVTDIDDYPSIEKSETNDSEENASTQKIVLVTGGAGNSMVAYIIYFCYADNFLYLAVAFINYERLFSSNPSRKKYFC